MAKPTCPKCNGFSFEVQEVAPYNAVYVMLFINCAACGCVVGVKEYFNAGVMLEQQNRAIKAIAAAMKIHVDLQGT